jgi:hypothetical protein
VHVYLVVEYLDMGKRKNTRSFSFCIERSSLSLGLKLPTKSSTHMGVKQNG